MNGSSDRTGVPRKAVLPGNAVEALEHEVERALRTGDTSRLAVVGYGEISSVLLLALPEGDVVCKRLPLFDSLEAVEAYRRCFEDYLERLEDRGVRPCPSALEVVARNDGRLAVWCVQPALDGGSIGPAWLASRDQDAASALFSRIVDRVLGCVASGLGLDGQLSNWSVAGDDLSYLDVTTPLMRDEQGRERLDTELFIRSLPWALRSVVRRLLLHQILDKYYQPRGVLLDFLANLYKESLDAFLPAFMEIANERIAPPLTLEEIQDYYREDARMWELLQRLRRADRWWQRRVRRRTYEFLLPGSVSRNL